MKIPYFPILVGIGILSFCGLTFFLVSGPQNQAPIKTYTAIPLPSKNLAKEGFSNMATRQVTESTDAQNSDAQPQTLGDPAENENEKRLAAKLREITKASEYQECVDTKTQEWVNAYKQTGIFNLSFQAFFDFFESQGMPRVDFAQSALEAFREYFPTGEPEDYDAEMAARFQEIFVDTPGTRSEASLSTAVTLYAEPDFSAWILGRFKGELGPHLQWMDEQTAIATLLENVSFPSTTEGQTPVRSVTDVKMTLPTTPTDSLHTRPSESSENRQSNVADMPHVDTPVPLSVEQVSSIRETLRHHGTDDGVLHLLKTDTEAAEWLLGNFNSLDDIDAWLSENTTEALPTKRQYQPNSQSLPTEEPPWGKIPE